MDYSFIHYEITAIDEMNPSEVIHHHGFLTARYYTEAMEQLVSYYGEDKLLSVYIEFVGSGGTPLVIDEDKAEVLVPAIMECFDDI